MYKRDYEHRYYATVSANSTSYNDFDIASGESFMVYSIGGDAVHLQDVKVEIIRDPLGTPEILLCVHGDTVQTVPNTKISGSDKIRIKLTNDSDQSETIGGFINGEYYGA